MEEEAIGVFLGFFYMLFAWFWMLARVLKRLPNQNAEKFNIFYAILLAGFVGGAINIYKWPLIFL